MTVAADRPHPMGPPLGEAVEGAEPVEYVGLVTRGIAFALDAGVIQLVALAVAGTFALILSVVSPSDPLKDVIVVIGGVVYVLWLTGYFVVFWSSTGQTPGDRVFQIRVRRADDDEPPSAKASVVRLVMLVLAALPLFAGFLPILFDARRRGIHDMVARTVVVVAPPRPTAPA
jgi:uncharacterized RDD family membrane protein YckC